MSETPNNFEADGPERIFLSGMLKGDDEADDGLEMAAASDLRQHSLRVVYEAVAACRLAGGRATPEAVFLHLRSAGRLQDLGANPAAFLGELFDAVPTASSMRHAAAQVVDASKRRALAYAADEMRRDLADNVEPAVDTAARFEQAIQRVTDGGAAGGPTGAGEEFGKAVTAIDEAAAGRIQTFFARTGFPALDKGLGGFCPGQLVVLAARPGDGKTSMAVQMMAAVARQGVGVLFFSLEMSKHDIMMRLLASELSVPLSQLRGVSPLRPENAAKVAAEQHGAGLAGLPFWLDDRSSLKASQVAVEARRYRRRGVKLVVVDYLQLLQPENARDPRHLQVGHPRSGSSTWRRRPARRSSAWRSSTARSRGGMTASPGRRTCATAARLSRMQT